MSAESTTADQEAPIAEGATCDDQIEVRRVHWTSLLEGYGISGRKSEIIISSVGAKNGLFCLHEDENETL